MQKAHPVQMTADMRKARNHDLIFINKVLVMVLKTAC